MTRRTSEEAPQANLPTPSATASVGAELLLEALAEYRVARRRLLNVLGLPMSNRDPVPEVAEHLVADILGGTLAPPSRVQAAWDVETPAGKVQVRTLSNTGADAWIN